MSIDRAGCTAGKHGDENAYCNYGCRCDDARDARRIAMKRRREHRHTSPRVDVTGTARRLQALAALGWSIHDLASMLGCSPQLVERRRTARLARLRADSARRITDLYEQLQGTPGPSEKARAHAARVGWAPPLLWHEHTIDDPAATPIVDTQHHHRDHGIDLDEHTFLTRNGLTQREAAAKLGVLPKSVERARYRAAIRDIPQPQPWHDGDSRDEHSRELGEVVA